MIYVLFVCTGNICRSPTAEGVFRNLVESHGLAEEFFIDSAGTHPYHVGSSPDHRAQEVALEYGLDISNLIARQVVARDFEQFDYILVMDQLNMKYLKKHCLNKFHNKIKFFLEYIPEINDKEVPDPYYDEEDGFRVVYSLITKASKGFLKVVK